MNCRNNSTTLLRRTSRWCKAALFGAAFALVGTQANAQVTVTNPGNTTPALNATYTTLALAVADYNTRTAISGPVTITLDPGNPQTAPAGGYVLSGILTGASNTNRVTFAGSANTITASGAHTVGALNDGIFKIHGSDFVTISGFTLTENAANIVNTPAGSNTMTEMGIAIVYAATTNGCQGITISGNTIDLNRTYTNTFGIYSNSTHSATAYTSSATATGATGGNHDLVITGNTVTDVNQGIIVVGPTAAADQNTGVIIGGSAPNANTITNYGTAAQLSSYANVSGTMNGILVRNATNYDVSFNSITSSAGGVTSGTLRGIFVPSFSNAPTGTITNNLNSNTIALQSGSAAGAVLGIVNETTTGNTTTTLNINSNNFTQLNHSVSGTGAITGISNAMAVLTTNINSNTFTNIATNTTGSFTFITASYTMPAGGSTTANSNSISGTFNKTGAGGTITLFTNSQSSPAGTTHTFNNNNFSNITVTGATTIAGWSNNDGGAPTKNASGNTFSNWTGGTNGITGMLVSFSGAATVTNNTVSNISSAGSITGISTGSGTQTFTGNTVHTLTTTGASAVTGISCSGGTTNIIEKNKIYNLEANNASGTVNGILVSSGTTVTLRNNIIGDLRTPVANAANPLIGISITGGTTVNAHYNTVRIAGTSSGALFGSSAFSVSSTPTFTAINNIGINIGTPNGAAFNVAYRRSTTTLTSYGANSNNNLFYAGTPSASNLIFHDGTNSDQTMAAFKSRVASRDASSVTENPTFLSLTGSSANFLHVDPTVATQVESGGVTVAGITDDFDGNVRNVSTPDIGADEFTGIAADLTGPTITYTPLGNTCGLGNRTLSATITDASGVPTAGAGLPVLYWRINAGAYTAATGTFISGSQYDFSFGAGVLAADVVSYYIAAQDNAGTPNVSANPSGGAAGPSINPPAFSTAPTTPNSYTIQSTLAAGTYLIPTNFASLTAAAAAYNTQCIGGPVIFEIEASYTGAGETYPITLNANPDASATNTLTIQPGAGVTNTISGSSTGAIILLNGADYVRIQGSNAPVTNTCCPLAQSSRNLTITNTNTGTSSAVIWMSSGSTNNAVRNCVIQGNAPTTTLYGIGMGGATISTSSLGTANNSNTIENNAIRATQVGIYTQGASAAAKNTGNVIILNDINAVSPNNVQLGGVRVGFEGGLDISCNNIANMSGGATTYGIQMGLTFSNSYLTFTGNEVTGATVTKNKIHNVVRAGDGTAFGISLASVSSAGAATNLIANNFISDVRTTSGTPSDSPFGIVLGGGTTGGTNVYYNTIAMTGVGATSSPTFGIAVGGSNPVVDIRNNIFSNLTTTSGNKVAIALAYGAPYTNLTCDYNDFWTAAGAGGAMGSVAGWNAAPLANFATWQSTTGKDANSKNVLPVFVGSPDLHLDNTNASNIANLMTGGTTVSVTDDIDCASRGATPTIGADEFTVPACSGAPSAGTSTLGAGPYCAGGTFGMSNTGASSGLGITYQWQTGPTGGPYTNVVGGSGATSTSYTTAALTAGTYFYVLKVKCSTGPDSTLSNEISLTVNALPTVSVSPAPANAAICGGVGNVVMTASGASTYTWLPNTALAPNNTSNPVTSTASATTTYTVTGTDANGCVDTETQVVNVGPNPTMGTPTATPATVCFDGTSTLNATGTVPGYVQGVGGSSFIDISATGTLVSGSPADDSEHQVTIPSFTYNGVAYTDMRVGNNGKVVMGVTSGEVGYANVALPYILSGTGATTAGFRGIMPWWDDLTPGSGNSIRTEQVGNLYIVQWTNEDHFDAAGTGTVSFQLQLDLVTGVIYFAYSDVDFTGSAAQDKGGSATVGLQFSATEFLQTSFNTQSLSNGQVISYTPATPTFDWSPATYLDDATNNASPVASNVQTTETYTVTGTSPIGCTATATVTLTMQPAADAGADDAVTYCESSATNDLSLLVTGDGGGTWPDGGPNYDATTQSPGVYRYVVAGVSPCPNDTAYFTVTEQAAPDAGTNGSDVVCINDASFALVGLLGGTPDGGGTWTDPGNNPHSGTFVPGTDAAGVYTYTVNAISPCTGSVNATVTVTYDNTDTDSDGIIDCLDNCPTVIGVQGSTCDANGPLPGFFLGALNGSCVCVAVPCTETVSLDMRAGTAGASEEIGWEIVDQNVNTVICAGGTEDVPYSTGITAPIVETCCLPAGCYRLRVYDSAGDGFASGGGYQLRETFDQQRRIIDNTGNFTTGSTSALANTYENGAFCVPIGDVKPIFSSCDKRDWTNYRFLVVGADAAVSSTYDVIPPIVQPTNSGYEYWFYDPNGGYSYRRFISHANPDPGAPGTGANRACHFKVNRYVPQPPGNQSTNQEIPYNTLLNVRVRGRVNGNNQPFGPACFFKIDAALAFCPAVSLQDDPADADYSCNVTRVFGGVNSSANRIVAKPPYGPAMTPPAPNVRYQFRFRIPGELGQPYGCITRPMQTSPTLYMNWTTGQKLKCSATYEVDVRVSRDGGATWCTDSPTPVCNGGGYQAWGKICTVTITPNAFCQALTGGNNNLALEGNGGLTMYPNPNRGDQLFINLSTVETEVNTVSVDIFDLSGKKVTTRAIPVQDGTINTALDLNGSLAGGMYLVNITAGTKVYTERLVIQP
ncbi:MAG: T9SS type A sorting domain-containing protein [Flavobacteriales bacterium]|nr:T9SS type A sorting domain-containing protein [Flavobacteriales bacterium]